MPQLSPMSQELHTERLHLRSLQPSDAAQVRMLWGERDPRSLHLIDAEGRPSVEDMASGLRSQLAETERSGIALLAIDDVVSGEFLGYCGLIVGRASLEEPEIAFELFRRVHGRGYATEAARAVLADGLATGRTTFWSTVRAWNTPSFRVLEKIGFVRTERVDPDPERGDLVWLTGPGMAGSGGARPGAAGHGRELRGVAESDRERQGADKRWPAQFVNGRARRWAIQLRWASSIQ